MASLLRFLGNAIRRPPANPLIFPRTEFGVVRDEFIFEEQGWIAAKIADHYYPVHIAGVYDGRYQVLGKLGFGSTSTVWLAHDLWCVIQARN